MLDFPEMVHVETLDQKKKRGSKTDVYHVFSRLKLAVGES